MLMLMLMLSWGGIRWKIVVRKLPILGGHPPSFQGSWWWSWCLVLSSLNLIRVFRGKLLLGTSTYLEDVLHPAEVPDGDHDGWDHLHWTWCWCWCWCCTDADAKLLSGTSTYLEDVLRNLRGHPPSSWGSWWWSWWLGSPSLNWILPEVSKNI